MSKTGRGPKACSKNRARLIGGVALLLLGGIAQAATINIGALSYDTFIPAGNGSPGVFAFNLSNLTGAFSLPPDFPVSGSLTFGSATLTLTLSDLSLDVIPLGDIGPGFLVDGGGNPIVQVPGNTVFDSAKFTATLAPLTFALSDGTKFTTNSSSIVATLLPSSGTALAVDVDNTAIVVSGAVSTATPEPSSGTLALTGLLGLAWCQQRRRGSITRVRERI